MQIILDDELKKIVEYDKINEIQRVVNFMLAEDLRTGLYTFKSGMKIAIYKSGDDMKVIKVKQAE